MKLVDDRNGVSPRWALSVDCDVEGAGIEIVLDALTTHSQLIHSTVSGELRTPEAGDARDEVTPVDGIETGAVVGVGFIPSLCGGWHCELRTVRRPACTGATPQHDGCRRWGRLRCHRSRSRCRSHGCRCCRRSRCGHWRLRGWCGHRGLGRWCGDVSRRARTTCGDGQPCGCHQRNWDEALVIHFDASLVSEDIVVLPDHPNRGRGVKSSLPQWGQLRKGVVFPVGFEPTMNSSV